MREISKRRTYRKKRSTSKIKSSNKKSRRSNALTKGTALAKGPTSDIVKCCMCDRKIRKEDGLMPVRCFTQYGTIRAHRICHKCWFNKFAKEGVHHACPGCVKRLPLNGPPIDNSIVIDLTED